MTYNAHFRDEWPQGLVECAPFERTHDAPAPYAPPLPGLLDEIDSAWIALWNLLRCASEQCPDYPGARRMLADHAAHIERSETAYRARLAQELPAGVRRG